MRQFTFGVARAINKRLAVIEFYDMTRLFDTPDVIEFQGSLTRHVAPHELRHMRESKVRIGIFLVQVAAVNRSRRPSLTRINNRPQIVFILIIVQAFDLKAVSRAAIVILDGVALR